MAAGGRKRAPVKRRQKCGRCGENEWQRRSNGGWQCRPCNIRYARAWRAANPAKTLWDEARKRARRDGTTFTISVDDVRAAWPSDGRCPALGIRLTPGRGRQHDGSPTLDRLNPLWGYEPGNVAVISLKANRGKSNLTARELERLAAWMRRRGLS